jgi:adenylate cyclase
MTDDLTDFLVAHGLASDDLGALIDGYARRLSEAGVKLWRFYVAVPARHPLIFVVGRTWRRGEATAQEAIAHGGPSERFARSPFKLMLDRRIPRLRRRLDGSDPLDFPVLTELQEAGGTDYYARIVAFGDPDAPVGLPGMIASWTADAQTGFDDAQIAIIERSLSAFALAVYRIQLQTAAIGMLDAYLGRDVGRRVFSGETARGAVTTLHAAVMFADLRGFSAFAEAAEGAAVVATLNSYFDLLGDAIDRHGGQILKFIGDGLLATFAGEGDGPCARAAAAAVGALDAARRHDAQRQAQGQRVLPIDIALHVGALLYGNVGAAHRVDFTAIGPAVNEVSRLEQLCGELDRPVLMSAPFARACGRAVVSLGAHRLRGMGEAREVFAFA